MVEHLTAETYQACVSSGNVVVDFYADWCGPCGILSPVIEKAAEKYAGKIRFYKVNVDNDRSLAMSNRIMSIPCLLYLKDGQQVDRSQGALFEDELDRYLKVFEE